MLGGLRNWMRARPATAFVVLAFLLSWAAWLPLLAAVQGWIPMRPRPGLHLLGALGPATAALVVVGVVDGRPGLRQLCRRLVAWRRRRRAWAFALLTPPLLLVVAAPLSAWVSGSSPAADLSQLMDTEPNPVYGDDWPQRRHAQLDRQHAKDDRKSSQDDRIALTAEDAEHRDDES